MTIDDRVRDALHASADPIEPTPGSWDRIEARFDDPLRPVRKPRGAFVLAGVAMALLAVLITTVAIRSGDDGNVTTDDRVEPSTTTRPLLPSARIVVIDKDDRGATSMTVLPSRTQAGTGAMGAADGIRPGAPVAVTPDGGSMYVVRGSGESQCGDEIFSQPIGPGARSGDQILTAFSPTVSTDGRYLAYLRCGSGDGEGARIVLRDLANGAERETAGLFQASRIAFAPDFRHLLVDGRLDLRQPVKTFVLDIVGGETGLGREVPVEDGVEVTGFAGLDAVVVIDSRRAVQTVEVRDVATGEVRMRVIDGEQVAGTITNAVADRSGKSFLITVDDASLYRWTVGDQEPTRLADDHLGAAWMPGGSAEPQPTASMPNGIAAVRAGELVVLGARDGAQHSQLGSAPGNAVAPTADGRTWVLGASAPPQVCDHSAPRTPPVLERVDPATGVRQDLVGGAYSPMMSSNDVVAYGYACDGNGLGLTDVGSGQNFRADVFPRRGEVVSVHPLGWSPDGRRLLSFVNGRGARLFATRFSEEFFVAARPRDADSLEIRAPRVRIATMSGNDAIAAVLPADPRVVFEYRIAETLAAPRRLFEVPGPVTAIVADPTGRHFLIVTGEGELWRWSRAEGDPALVASDVSAAAWLPDLPAAPSSVFLSPNPDQDRRTDAALPADFPQQVPLPEGLDLHRAARSGSSRAAERMYTLTFSLDGTTPDEAVRDYQRALIDAGFSVRSGGWGTGSEMQEQLIRAQGRRWDVTAAIRERERADGWSLMLHVYRHGQPPPETDLSQDLDQQLR